MITNIVVVLIIGCSVPYSNYYFSKYCPYTHEHEKLQHIAGVGIVTNSIF